MKHQHKRYAGVVGRKPPRYDVPKAAPRPLRLVQQFVNTVDHENAREWLGSEDELEAWLVEHGLPSTGADAEHARVVREAFRALLVANNDRSDPPPEALCALNASAERAPVAIRLDPPGRPVLVGNEWLGALLAAAFAALLDPRWPRLKACRNCGWAFYDESRNRSARWCSMLLCGNRLKTRDYRARRGAAPARRRRDRTVT